VRYAADGVREVGWKKDKKEFYLPHPLAPSPDEVSQERGK